MEKKVVLVGYSGHGLVVAEAAVLSGLLLKYYLERQESIYNPFDLEYLGFDGAEQYDGWARNLSYILGVGDNLGRAKIANRIITNRGEIINVVHPRAYLSKITDVGNGNFISANTIVNTAAIIGNCVILNTGCIIEHECVIGDFVHVAPGAILAGNVSVGDFSFIGANSVIKQGVKIGKHVTIGAGTVVLRDISDGETVVGNPGRAVSGGYK